MLDLLLSTLKTFDGVEYLIKEEKIRRIENYSIKKQSEMAREVEARQLNLTLYVTFTETDEAGEENKFRGSYKTEIHPGTSSGQLHTIIAQGVYAAGFVKNAWYPLVSPADSQASGRGSGSAPGAESAGCKATLKDDLAVLAQLQDAFYVNDCFSSGNLSYSEFYLTRSDVRIINSSGVDVSYSICKVFIETAVHWRNDKNEEIEISESYTFSLPAEIKTACDMLKARIADLFTVAEKKSTAQPTPQVGDINILLTGECLVELLNYYPTCSNAQLVYQQLSTFQEGAQVQGKAGGSGDCITLTLDPAMDGSSDSRPYDDDGLPVVSQRIIEDGKLLKYQGNTRFASYLGITPTGSIKNIHVTGGTASMEDLRSEPHLELVSFSGFQVNPITGDFGSEIRLGYYFDGEKTVPVTGGSITGNMARVQDTMRMSAQERQYNNYWGPATVSIRGASISGVS